MMLFSKSTFLASFDNALLVRSRLVSKTTLVCHVLSTVLVKYDFPYSEIALEGY